MFSRMQGNLARSRGAGEEENGGGGAGGLEKSEAAESLGLSPSVTRDVSAAGNTSFSAVSALPHMQTRLGHLPPANPRLSGVPWESMDSRAEGPLCGHHSSTLSYMKPGSNHP